MPTSTLLGDLAGLIDLNRSGRAVDCEFVALQPRHRDDVAALYLASYPPGAAVADLGEAQREMDATFAGEYGVLWPDASPMAIRERKVVGSIQVVARSPWDPDLDCPFIIELFVHPDARGLGIGRALLTRAAVACRARGENHIALRTGEGTSPAARQLYHSAGMRPI